MSTAPTPKVEVKVEVAAKPAQPARAPRPKPQTAKEAVQFAANRALAGGIPGMVAMAIQVGTLMWLRTTMNYQYRYGGTMRTSLAKLYKEGGVVRFYRGMMPALIQGPLARFGDCFANDGALALLDSFDRTKNLPVAVKTATASVSAGLFRIFLMPVDCFKTIMQVEGRQGLPALYSKIRTGGPLVLFHGALAAAGATMVGHYPWFLVFNWMSASWKVPDTFMKRLWRNACIGFSSSAISDVCSNSIRVVKTYRQTSKVPVSYMEAIKNVYKSEGLKGLFGRGLTTRILAHGVNGIVFTVAWRQLGELWDIKFLKSTGGH
eukprot:TRINITY_DN433_c0_g1_i1.p1 TRINITY_DN433_c0_g1~~TRINITY_DN433_c0_g1_i1.p1  ORF type:complete len:320 (+),score=53.73 TRINITY_DN433_c0_g1_i1:66-1025(+)